MHTAQPHDHGNLSHRRESDALVTILHNYISRRTLLRDSMAGAALTASRSLLPHGVEAVAGVGFTPPGEGQGSTFAQPASRWPDQQADMPPRPSVVAIYRHDGGKVGA